MVADALRTGRRLLGQDRPVLVRADSAFSDAEVVHAARTGGAEVSITVRLDPAVKKAIDAIIAFSSKKKAQRVTGRLIVRRIPDANVARNQATGRGTQSHLWRFHAFFTTTDLTCWTPSPRTRPTAGTR